MKEQLGVASGSWYQGSVKSSIRVSATVYHIETAEAVAQWFDEQPLRRLPKGWTVSRYDFADSANMAVYVDPSNSYTQFSLHFGRGRFLAEVSSISKVDVEWVAQFLLKEMSVTQEF